MVSCWTDSQSIFLNGNSWKTEKEGHAGTTIYYEILDPSSRKCASQCSALCSAAFDKKQYGDAAASLLNSHPATFFILKSKIGSERTPFWVNRRHPEVCNAGLKRHPTSCVPGTVAVLLEKLCAGTRDILWKWRHCSWWLNKIKPFFWNQSHYFVVRPRIRRG